MRPIFGLPVFLLLAAPLASASDPTADARAALDQFYAERLKLPSFQLINDPEPKVSPPPYERPVKQLASDKAEERRAGAAYLRELLALALKDETSGKAPWRNTPFWGGGADVPARDLRDLIARQLAQAKPVAEALPLLKWYLENEPIDRFLGPVVEALGKFESEDADALRTELATKPHPNAAVAAAVIQQIAARKKVLPADTLAALCHHHRTPVRDAARVLNKQQGGENPGPFNPTKAVRSGPVKELMDRVLKLMPNLPGAQAAFATVTVRYLDDKKVERNRDDHQGWLVKNEKGVVEIYTPYGRFRTFHNNVKTKIWQHEKEDNGVKSWQIDATTEVTVTTTGTGEPVKEAVAARKSGNASNELSEHGGLSGQFRGSGATLFEVILSAWLYRSESLSHKWAQAARG